MAEPIDYLKTYLNMNPEDYSRMQAQIGGETLPEREMRAGYAEIFKYGLIQDTKFLNWLLKNGKKILKKHNNSLIHSIYQSCKCKALIVSKDEKENNIRALLNFGHTFAHAIEVKNNYSKKVTHGEAVLSGMILAARVSLIKKVCNRKIIDEINKIYDDNNLSYTYKKYSNINSINSLIPYLKNDKKNNDDKINFILLKKIGETALPNKYKISLNNLKKMSKSIAQY